MFEIKDELTRENILLRIDEFSIFKAYCPNFKEIDRKFIAELDRSTKEGIPSANITYYRGRLWYKDFGNSNKAIDCFGYVKTKFNVSYIEALNIINIDFNLGLQGINKNKTSSNYNKFSNAASLFCKLKVRGEFTLIKPKFRKWLLEDKRYWFDKYGITKETLEYYNVKPITEYLLVDTYYSTERNSYSYLIDKEDKNLYYKIYQPYSTTLKWISNCKAHHYQGYNQLPMSGDLLVITKSLKDVMELYQYGIASIAPGSEAHQIDDDFMRLLRRRFERIIIFFDNDSAGIKGAHKITYHHGIESIIIPQEYGVKDLSDFVEKYSFEEGRKLINKLIYE